jgi:hypothetical protein
MLLREIATCAQYHHCRQAETADGRGGHYTERSTCRSSDTAGLLGDPVADDCSDNLADHVDFSFGH